MNRAGGMMERIVTWDNLRLAYLKARRGKSESREVREFTADCQNQLLLLSEELRSGVIKVGNWRQFVIHDPKERLITAPCFRERVLHHAIMNQCEPVFERTHIHDCYACRQGKGRIKAIERATLFCQRHEFFLKFDIRRYFDSIVHEILLKGLARRFKDRMLLGLFRQIVEAYEVTEGRGLPIGSLTSQHFANDYLAGLDRLVKEQLRVPAWVRYMDDCVVWGDSSQELKQWLTTIKQWLGQERELSLKPEPYINRTRLGIDFLGCRVYPWGRILNRRSKKRYRRKMKALEWNFLAGRIGESELRHRSQSLTSFTVAGGTKSWHFRQAVLNSLPVSGQGL